MMQSFALEHLVLSDGRVIIRAAHRNDEVILTQWFNDPGVYVYWGGKALSPEEIAAHCTVQIDDDICWPFIIMDSGKAVGYIHAWLRSDKTGGLDLFVAPQYRRRGIGLRAIRMLAEHLRDEHEWRRITVDPNVENTGAGKFFERAGFVETGEFIHEGNDVLTVMEFL
jgi:RimJ/RimL family protein N-acetyltransferase